MGPQDLSHAAIGHKGFPCMTGPRLHQETMMNETQTNMAYASKIKTALSSVKFPATKDQILQSIGTVRLDVATDKNVSVREALAPIRVDRFETPEALVNEISTAHQLGWPTQ